MNDLQLKTEAVREFFKNNPETLEAIKAGKNPEQAWRDFNFTSTVDTDVKEFTQILTYHLNGNPSPAATSLKEIPLSSEVKPHFDPAKELELCWINPLDEITAPPTFVEISGTGIKASPAFTGGNFSLLIGKAKAKKTFLQGSIIAAAVSGRTYLGRITGTLPMDNNMVLLFDTEQSAYHRFRAVQRACKMIGNSNPSNFKGFGLRKYTPAERVQIIEHALYNTPNIGFVAIDGLRDLLTRGINDEEEATAITTKILKWTEELNIHILLVLHQNKGDFNARGHIGTEAVNKGETVISVTVPENNKDISIVEAEFSRDLPFESFAFRIDEETGLPVECDIPVVEKAQTKQINPDTVNDEKHFKVLGDFYRINPTPTGEDLRDAIIYGFSGVFGHNRCRQFITHYITKQWIEKIRDGRKVIYNYKRTIF
jgi:hypothetical protein